MDPRLIPVLLLERGRLVKTEKFAKPSYVGDPVNTVRILNEKEVDEIVLLDIGAGRSGMEPAFPLLEEIAGEAFMPLAYGGRIRNLEDSQKVMALGFEKIVLGQSALEKPALIGEMAKSFGSQSVVVCVDAERGFWGGWRVRSLHGPRRSIWDWIQECVNRGAGEVILQVVPRDGTRSGYEISLYQAIPAEFSIPIVALGGAGSLDDVKQVLSCPRVHSAAAGSLFVHQGPHRAVLVSYPERRDLASQGILP